MNHPNAELQGLETKNTKGEKCQSISQAHHGQGDCVPTEIQGVAYREASLKVVRIPKGVSAVFEDDIDSKHCCKQLSVGPLILLHDHLTAT